METWWGPEDPGNDYELRRAEAEYEYGPYAPEYDTPDEDYEWGRWVDSQIDYLEQDNEPPF